MDQAAVYRAWPPQLPAAEREELLAHAVDWALAHGLVMRPPFQSNAPSSAPAISATATATVQHAPFALFPSPVPRQCLETARRLQPLFNRLVHRVATADRAFLDAVFGGAYVLISRSDWIPIASGSFLSGIFCIGILNDFIICRMRDADPFMARLYQLWLDTRDVRPKARSRASLFSSVDSEMRTHL